LGCIDSLICCVFRDRPAAIQIEVKSIDDTSNFDEFPDIDLKWREFCCISQRTIVIHSAVAYAAASDIKLTPVITHFVEFHWFDLCGVTLLCLARFCIAS